MIGTDGKWVTLASDFPATLNKEARETELKPGESPDAYGMDLDTPGLLAAISTEPTGTARIQDTYPIPTPGLGGEDFSIGLPTWYWLYNRLWTLGDGTHAPTNYLRFGAPDYHDVYIAQRHGTMSFAESATAITTFVPVAPGGLVVVKSDGSFFIPNANARNGKFEKLNIHQDFVNGTANQVSSFDGIAYMVNADGVFAFDGQKVVELTANVRNTLAPFNASAITFDHDKKWMIGGATDWAVDLNSGKLFDYSTSGFLYTSPAIRGDDHEPLSVDLVALMVDHSSTAGGQIQYQVKVEEQAWSDTRTVDVDYTDTTKSRIDIHLDGEDIVTCRKWQLRITSLPSNIRIKEIQIHNTLMEAQDYSA